jgi:hypothetical protein
MKVGGQIRYNFQALLSSFTQIILGRLLLGIDSHR